MRSTYDDYRPPFIEGQLIAVLAVSIVVEFTRYQLHPESRPILIVAGVLANLAYHGWNMPRDFKRTVASAVLGEASMPVIISLLATLALAVFAAITVFLRELIPPAQ